MSFKEVLDLDCETTVSLGGFNKKTRKENPTQIEGYFIGSKEIPSKMAKSGFNKLHIFQTEEGNIGVWGKTDLDRKMGSVPAGAMTRVTQSGTKPTPYGDMYKFKVEVDETNTIDVSAVTAPVAAASGYADDGYEDSEVGAEDEVAELEEAPPARPVRPTRAAAAPDAARQARVQALLGGKK